MRAAMHRIQLLETDQNRKRLVRQILTEEGDVQQPNSAPLESSQCVEERPAVGGLDEWLEGLAASGKPRQPRETREMVCGGVGITEQAEYELYRLPVEGRVLETAGMSRGHHGKAPEARNLRMRHRHTSADAGRKNRLTLEKARHNLLARFDQPGLLEELSEVPE